MSPLIIAIYGHYTGLMTYLRVYYLQGDAFRRWARAYQPAVYTNMETNNYIESWHNQLKTTCLRRKQNRRVDRLVFIEPAYILNVQRLALNIGRMSPAQRDRRRRQIEAERKLEDSLPIMVNADNEPLVYKVMSFRDENVWYEVNIEQSNMVGCSCTDFVYRQNACKHMFLLHRLYSYLLPYEKSFQEISFLPVNTNADALQLFHERAPREGTTIRPEAAIPLARTSNITTDIANLQAALREYNENPHVLNESNLDTFRTGLSMLLSALSINDDANSDNPPNVNMETQRC